MLRSERGTKISGGDCMHVTPTGQRQSAQEKDSQSQSRWSRGPRATSTFVDFDIASVDFGHIADILRRDPRVGDLGPDVDGATRLSL